jgi:hypothetical protein
MESVRAEPTVSNLFASYRLFQDLNELVPLRAASRAVAEAAQGDDDRYQALRLLADALASSSERPDEQEAADIYAFLLRSGLACDRQRADGPDVKHNLASLLAIMGLPGLATVLWEEAYSEDPSDAQIRQGFAAFLSNVGRRPMAAEVLLGQRVEPLNLEREPLPESFSSVADPWWRKLAVNTLAPCPTSLFGRDDATAEAARPE